MLIYLPMIRMYLSDGSVFEFEEYCQLKAWVDIFHAMKGDVMRIEGVGGITLELPEIDDGD